MDDMYNSLFDRQYGISINFKDILKLPLVVFTIGNIFYSFMLTLKIKVLSDTVDSPNNGKIKALVYFNLLISIITAILASILILLG